ncbi:MAG: ABC transporter ATP-binding protein/permease [Cystobacterineae bacterium]|nr:ABC transporter ATP-binding protein/permease [Cystobacterineae bacterium]
MVILGLLELGSIVSLSFFAGVIHAPEQILDSRYVAALLRRVPRLVPFFADMRYIMLYAVLLPIVLVVAKNITSAIVTWKTSLLGNKAANYVGSEIMRRFVYMPYDWHLSSSSADTLTKLSWRQSLGQLLLQSLVAYSNFIVSGLLFLGLFFYAPGLTLLVVCAMAIVAISLYGSIRKGIDRASDGSAKAHTEESRASMAAVRGIREILIYQQQPMFLRAIAQAMTKGIRPQAFLGFTPPIPSWALESTGFLLIGLHLAWLVLVKNADQAKIITDIAMLILTAWRVLPSLNRAVGAIVSIRAHKPMGIPCLEYMESLGKVPEQTFSEEWSDFAVRESIRLENVHYRYPGAKEDALCGVTLEIPKGACVGFVGKSGAGKSTLINILSGLLQPTKGQMRVDGCEMEASVLAAFRRKIGYVPQNPYLMAGTVAENVAFSEWGRPLDEERLRKAALQAEMDFLGENFEGLSRKIGESGAGLSGGQAQRVTIARALYPAPDVLIFDEAASSLDHVTEAAIQRTISALPQGMTRVFIAHRLSSLQQCDTIYWLEGGKIVRQGAAKEILKEYIA